jgi:hypothetical protein
MIVLGCPFSFQAMNTARWEGWQSCVEGSVWNNFLCRRGYIGLKPKTATAMSEGSSSSMVWIVAAPAAVVVAGVVLIVSHGRTVEE